MSMCIHFSTLMFYVFNVWDYALKGKSRTLVGSLCNLRSDCLSEIRLLSWKHLLQVNLKLYGPL